MKCPSQRPSSHEKSYNQNQSAEFRCRRRRCQQPKLQEARVFWGELRSNPEATLAHLITGWVTELGVEKPEKKQSKSRSGRMRASVTNHSTSCCHQESASKCREEDRKIQRELHTFVVVVVVEGSVRSSNLSFFLNETDRNLVP